MRQCLGNGSAVTCIGFVNNAHFVMAGHENGSLAVYRMLECKRLALASGHAKPVRKITYQAEKNTIMTVGEDGHIKFWEFVVGVRRRGHVQEVDSVKRKTSPSLTSYSFFEDPRQPEKREPTMALNLLKDYAVDSVEMLDAVFVKKDIVMVAGVSNSTHQS